jgi:hypothetical protein
MRSFRCSDQLSVAVSLIRRVYTLTAKYRHITFFEPKLRGAGPDGTLVEHYPNPKVEFCPRYTARWPCLRRALLQIQRGGILLFDALCSEASSDIIRYGFKAITAKYRRNYCNGKLTVTPGGVVDSNFPLHWSRLSVALARTFRCADADFPLHRPNLTWSEPGVAPLWPSAKYRHITFLNQTTKSQA